MNKFKYLLVSVVLLILSLYCYRYFIDNKPQKTRVSSKVQKTVFTKVVKNGAVPIVIQERGSLRSKDRLVLYSEVQGVMKKSKKEFREGVSYKKGEVLLTINSDELEATLKAQKSVFQNLIVSIIPDVRMDFSESFEDWENYLKKFDVAAPIVKLPKPKSDKEKYFVTAKNIFTTYYNIKNLEVRREKYLIRAPYDGVVIEANTNRGALVRIGQKMGEFINTDSYELELSINASLAQDVRVGKKVMLTNLNKTIEVTGKVVRTGGKIDVNSQTLSVFIEVMGTDLREGMFLEARITARNVPESYEIPRTLLRDKNKVFIFKDSILASVKIAPIFYNENTVIVKGLKNGVELVSNNVPGAFEGMRVKKVTMYKE